MSVSHFDSNAPFVIVHGLVYDVLTNDKPSAYVRDGQL